MPFADVEGGRLHYRLDGRPDLPVLLLSNCLGADLSMWDAQVPAFTEHFYLLRFDSFGHGQSTFGARKTGIDRLGKDVVSLIDHLEFETVSFCGISIGGMVGQWLALHAGNRLKSAILSNTAARIGTVESWTARIQAIRKDGMACVAPTIAERWFTPPFAGSNPGVVERFRSMIAATPADAYVASSEALRDADLRDEVSGIRTRTLVIAGTQDKSTPPEGSRFLAEKIPGARYVELDAAHLSNVELAQNFSQEALKFLISQEAMHG